MLTSLRSEMVARTRFVPMACGQICAIGISQVITQLVVLVAYGAAVPGGGAVLGFCREGRGVAGDLHHIVDQRAGDVPCCIRRLTLRLAYFKERSICD